MEIDQRTMNTIFNLIDQIPKDDLIEGFNALVAVEDDWILRHAIIQLVPEGQMRLRKYNFLLKVPGETIRLIFDEYMLDHNADEELKNMLKN